MWLGRKDSNLRMREPKSRALPLGHAPPCETPLRAHLQAAVVRSGGCSAVPFDRRNHPSDPTAGGGAVPKGAVLQARPNEPTQTDSLYVPTASGKSGL